MTVEKCENCGHEIRTMAYRGSRACGWVCAGELKLADAQLAAAPDCEVESCDGKLLPAGDELMCTRCGTSVSKE